MLYEFTAGDTPLLVNVPHAGTAWPEGIEPRPAGAAADLPDTDWHVDRLVAAAPRLGAGLLVARYSRYLIDLNRGRDDKPLYAGATTGLVPEVTFDGDPVHAHGAPQGVQVQTRIEQFWQPYHDHIDRTLRELRRRHGHAVLFDVHSIRSRVPRLFEGRLTDFNLGTFEGRSCDAGLQQAVADRLGEAEGFDHVVNGRFKGGFITRHYGQPEAGIHALQLEIAQACYMHEQRPDQWDLQRAQPLMAVLEDLIAFLATWRP